VTADQIALRELLAKGPDATFPREMVGFAAQHPMELDAVNSFSGCLSSLVKKGVLLVQHR
jgi:hypothetical protein